MYFGNDAIKKYNYVNEAFYTKKQLQDPNILNKVLKKAEDQRNTIMGCSLGLGLAVDIVAGIATGSIVVSIVGFLPFIVGTVIACFKLLELLPSDDQRVKELESKVKRLKENTEKLKYSREKQQIISNCDKVLDSINKRNKKIEDNSKKAKLEQAKYVLDCINDFKEGYMGVDIGSVFPDSYIFYIAEKLYNIKPHDLESKMIKRLLSGDYEVFSYADKSPAYNYFDAYEDGDPDQKKYYDKLSKSIPEIENNGDLYFLFAIDDTVVFYSPLAKMFYYGDWFDFYKSKSYFDIVNKMNSYKEYNGYYSKKYKSEGCKDMDELIEYIKLIDNSQEGIS